MFCCGKKQRDEDKAGPSEDLNDVKEMKDMFDLFDQDRNGLVTKQEVMATFNSIRLPVSEEQAQKLIEEFDKNADNMLEFDEFKNLMKKYLKDTNYPTTGMFSFFDQDDDGFVTLEEFQKSMRCLGIDVKEDQMKRIVPEFFTTGDQKLDYDGFNTMMQKFMNKEDIPM